MTDDQLELANAYVDDDLDDAGRARAEADAEVMAEVERLRDVRAVLREMAPPDPVRREQAIAAAVAALQAPHAPRAPAAVPRPARARRPWYGVVAAAAAVVLVVAGGLAVLRSGRGVPDGDDAGPASDMAAAREEATMAAGADDGDAAVPPAAAPVPDRADDAAATAPAADATAAQEAPSGGPRTAQRLLVADDADELLALVDERPIAPGAAPEPAARCTPGGTYVGRALLDGVEVEVFDEVTAVVAVDATSCELVGRAER